MRSSKTRSLSLKVCRLLLIFWTGVSADYIDRSFAGEIHLMWFICDRFGVQMHFYSSCTCSHQAAGRCSSALWFTFLKLKHMQATTTKKTMDPYYSLKLQKNVYPYKMFYMYHQHNHQNKCTNHKISWNFTSLSVFQFHVVLVRKRSCLDFPEWNIGSEGFCKAVTCSHL